MFAMLVMILMSIHVYLMLNGMTTWDLVIEMKSLKRSEIGPLRQLLFLFFFIPLPDDEEEETISPDEQQYEDDDRFSVYGPSEASVSFASGSQDMERDNRRRDSNSSMRSSVSDSIRRNVSGFLIGTSHASRPYSSQGEVSRSESQLLSQVLHRRPARSRSEGEVVLTRDLARLHAIEEPDAGFRKKAQSQSDSILMRSDVSENRGHNQEQLAASQERQVVEGKHSAVEVIELPTREESESDSTLQTDRIPEDVVMYEAENEETDLLGESGCSIDKPMREESLVQDSTGLDSIEQGETGGACTKVDMREDTHESRQPEDSTGGTDARAPSQAHSEASSPTLANDEAPTNPAITAPEDGKQLQVAREPKRDWLKSCGLICHPCQPLSTDRRC